MTSQEPRPAGPPERSGPGGPVRVRIQLAYDGTSFCGWARQPGLRSVQGELERGLRDVLRVPAGEPLRVAVAGRTDAGVHAMGQICHCDVPQESAERLSPATQRPGQPVGSGCDTWARLTRQLNGRLPHDIRVHSMQLAPDGFDARWSATWRRYDYRIATGNAADPLTRGQVLWHPRELDSPAMQQAAAPFVGEHNFAAFCRHRPQASTVRTILSLRWTFSPPASWDAASVQVGPAMAAEHRMEIVADAFCHSMVRSLVGAFIAVGEGRWPSSRPAELLAGGVRVPGAATAPAHGLCLMEVGYPPDDQLADQALRSRRWRGR